MPEIRTILAPVDFSASSTKALEYALEMAKTLGAKVQILHVYPLLSYALQDDVIPDDPRFVADLEAELEKQLAELKRRYEPRGVPLETKLVPGVPYAEILRVAASIPADVIVIGTHGRTGLRRMLLGSVAERVVRGAEIPVLTVRSPEGAKDEESQPTQPS